MTVSDGNTDDDVLHVSDTLPGLARAAGALVRGRQRRAGTNSSVTRQEKGRRRRRRLKKKKQEEEEEAVNKESRKGREVCEDAM